MEWNTFWGSEMNTDSICFWSAADGEHAEVVRGLLASYNRLNMPFDFHVFSDVPIPGCICHVVSPFHDPSYFYKIDLLERLVSLARHVVYVWVDADSYFARPLTNSFIAAVSERATFGFLCEDLTHASFEGQQWQGLSRSDLIRIARHYHLDGLRYTNAGLFAVRGDTVSRFADTCHRVNTRISQLCDVRTLNDERVLSVVHQLLSPGLPILYDHPHWYAVDHFGLPWPGERYGQTYGLGFGLPTGSWTARSWSHHFKYVVDPVIAHVMKSKAALRAFG